MPTVKLDKVLRCNILYSSLAGFCPFTDKFKLSFFKLFYCSVLTVYALSATIYYVLYGGLDDKSATIEQILDKVQVAFNFGQYLWCFVMYVLRREHYFKMTVNFINIDLRLRTLGMAVVHNSSSIKNYLLLICSICVCLFLYELYKLEDLFLAKILTSYSIYHSLSAGATNIFVLNSFLICLRNDFRILNSYFESLRRLNFETVNILLLIHHDLCSLSRELNDVFDVSLLICVSNCFLDFLSNSFYLCRSGLFGDEYTTVISITFIMLRVILLWQIVNNCDRVEIEAEQFNEQIGTLFISSLSKEQSVNKLMENHLLTKQKVCFNACGFFPIDLTLIHMMVSAMATYLIILIQIEAPDTN